jgi:hypothetical protein
MGAIMSTSPTRRHLLKTAAAGAGAVLIHSRRATATPRATVGEASVISHQPEIYHGWPTLTRRRNGQLLVVWSGGREAHVCPFGRVEMMRSDDDGQSWTWPRVLLDSAIDDRDAGVLETSKGTLLVTTFTSLAWEPIFDKAVAEKSKWSADKLARWRAAHARIDGDARKNELGRWMLRSTDGGLTWSPPYDCIVNSPHGPIELSDGRLLYAGKRLWHESNAVGVCTSYDDGKSWQWLAKIPARPGDDPTAYHELHAVEASDGTIVVQIRNHNKANERETLQSESRDGGKSWSVPRSIGVWGLPSFLLRLKDDRLLMTYGYRRTPYGNQARVSNDHGRSWSEPITVYGQGTSGDLGYPSTVQLEDGALLTVWYEKMKDSPMAQLRQTRWTLDS